MIHAELSHGAEIAGLRASGYAPLCAANQCSTLGRDMHILIVDDDTNVRQTLIHTVKYTGYDALGCANGVEALDYLHSPAECPCLMFLDVEMPVMGGWAVLQKIQDDSELATIPVVMISAGGDHTQLALAHGAVSFLKKPFDITMVMTIIKHYCES